MKTIHEPVGVMTIILAALLVSAWLSDLCSISLIAIIPLIGAVIGPDGLGILEPGSVLQIFGSIGMVFIFFMAGSNVRIASLRTRSSDALRSASSTLIWIAVPFFTGFSLGILAGLSVAHAVSIGFLLASGGAWTYPRPASYRSTETAHPEMPAFVSVAMISALLLFTLIAEGIPARSAAIVLASAFIASGLLRIILPRLTAFVFRHASPGGTIEISFLLFIIFAVSFGGAFLAIPPWFLAFITGVCLSRTITSAHEQRSRLFQLSESLFMPAALLLIGVTIPLGSFAQDSSRLLGVFLIAGSALLSQVLVILISRIAHSIRNEPLQFILPYAAFSLAVAWVLADTVPDDTILLPSAVLLAMLSAVFRPLRMNLRPLSAESRHISASTGFAEETLRMQGQASLIPSRIMIALSKPSSMPFLLELADILHGSKNRNPLFPIVVHSPEDAISRQSPDSETLLAGAVMRLSEMKKAALPINLESLNPGKGIVDESLARNVDTIILGWNRPPRLSNAFFGTVIDQVIAGTDQLIVVARGVFSWKQTQQLLIIVPPFVETHQGFTAVLQCIARFTDSVFCRVLALLPGENAQEAGRILRNYLPSGRWKETTYGSWRDIPSIVRNAAGSHDSVLLVCARPGEVSWFPALERLPHFLAEKSSNANMATIYLPGAAFFARAGSPRLSGESASSETGEEKALAGKAPLNLALMEALNAGRIRVNMQQAALADGILELLFAGLPNLESARIQELANHFVSTVQQQPIELEPGVVLLHERISGITRPVLCLGSHRSGFRIAVLSRPVQVLVLILVPENQSTREHLRYLADIASLFRAAHLTEHLLSAESPADILNSALNLV